MIDDWNVEILKGKLLSYLCKISVEHRFTQREHKRIVMEFGNFFDCYFEIFHDTLRKKLIEDFEKEWEGKVGFALSKSKATVNKRFGIK